MIPNPTTQRSNPVSFYQQLGALTTVQDCESIHNYVAAQQTSHTLHLLPHVLGCQVTVVDLEPHQSDMSSTLQHSLHYIHLE